MPKKFSNPVRNLRGLRAELHDRGLGLNAGNTWVQPTLDGDELDHLKRVNFAAVSWQEEEIVLVVRGTDKMGLSVRFAHLSTDGRYCRFRDRPARYLSPRLVHADPMTKRDFIASIAANPTLRIYKQGVGELVGLLVGPRHAKYKSLLTLQGDELQSWLVNEDPPPQNSSGFTTIREDNPAAGEAVRARILELYA